MNGRQQHHGCLNGLWLLLLLLLRSKTLHKRIKFYDSSPIQKFFFFFFFLLLLLSFNYSALNFHLFSSMQFFRSPLHIIQFLLLFVCEFFFLLSYQQFLYIVLGIVFNIFALFVWCFFFCSPKRKKSFISGRTKCMH